MDVSLYIWAQGRPFLREVALKRQIREIETLYFNYPMNPCLISSLDRDGRPNIMPAAWNSPFSHTPPLYGVAISPKRYSHESVSQLGEFVVNFVSFDYVKDMDFCGRVSGRDVLKFEKSRFTPVQGQVVKPPLIAESYASLECRTIDRRVYGDHTWFIGRIAAVTYESEAFEEVGIPNMRGLRPILYLGKNTYLTVDPTALTKF